MSADLDNILSNKKNYKNEYKLIYNKPNPKFVFHLRKFGEVGFILNSIVPTAFVTTHLVKTTNKSKMKKSPFLVWLKYTKSLYNSWVDFF